MPKGLRNNERATAGRNDHATEKRKSFGDNGGRAVGMDQDHETGLNRFGPRVAEVVVDIADVHQAPGVHNTVAQA